MIVNPVMYGSGGANFGKEVTVSYKIDSAFGTQAIVATPSGVVNPMISGSGTLTMYVGYPASINLNSVHTATMEKGYAGNLNGMFIVVPFEDGASFVLG